MPAGPTQSRCFKYAPSLARHPSTGGHAMVYGGADRQAAPPAVAPAQGRRRRSKSVWAAANALSRRRWGRRFGHVGLPLMGAALAHAHARARAGNRVHAHWHAREHAHRISLPSGAPETRRKAAPLPLLCRAMYTAPRSYSAPCAHSYRLW